jgi:transcriptional regulator with XRE-family HTH domain
LAGGRLDYRRPKGAERGSASRCRKAKGGSPTGIKQAYISQIECGRQNPTLATLTILALAVGKDVRTLLKPLPTATEK